MFGFGGDQTQGFKDSLNPWAAKNGIKIDYVQASSFDTLIRSKVAGNAAPDIALFPQPGLLKDIAGQKKLQPLDDVVDMASSSRAWSRAPWTPARSTASSTACWCANIKSLVWYREGQLHEGRLPASPRRIDELDALTDKIKADKTATTPWCLGIESAAATGWPATDWFEDLIMRYSGADGYNKWVKHEIKFDSPAGAPGGRRVREDRLHRRQRPRRAASRSRAQLRHRRQPDVQDPKPGCMLYKQGSFITTLLPEGRPGQPRRRTSASSASRRAAGGEKPILGGGDMAVAAAQHRGRPRGHEAAGRQEHRRGRPWAPASCLRTRTSTSACTRARSRSTIAKIAYAASIFLFDGSDQMPGEVGAGTFWKDMTPGSAARRAWTKP